MIDVRRLQKKDYIKTCNMVKKTLEVTFKKVYPMGLIKIFKTKYTPIKLKVRDKEMEVFIAVEKDTVLGIIALCENHVRTFFVHPDHQGKGIGRLLFNRLLILVKKKKIKKLQVEGSTFGQPIYRHFGFKKKGILNKQKGRYKYVDAIMEMQIKT